MNNSNINNDPQKFASPQNFCYIPGESSQSPPIKPKPPTIDIIRDDEVVPRKPICGDFTADDARNLMIKMTEEISWGNLTDLKALIKKYATKKNFIRLDLRAYSGKFTLEDITKFLESKNFLVRHHYGSTFLRRFGSNPKYLNSTISW